MRMNLEGRVDKIRLATNPPRNCLLPLFEAVVNSIHAIQAAKVTDGRIDIHVERDTSQQVMKTPDGQKITYEPIKSFRVVDNGIGFDSQNMASFEEADTLFKRHLGGKGVGRLMWLKVFQRVEVESVFTENGQSQRRSFRFSISDDGVAATNLEPVGSAARETSVHLLGMLQPYKEQCPKRTVSIADHVIQHSLRILATESSPGMRLHDPQGDGTIDLKRRYEDLKLSTSSADFEVGGLSFKMDHVLMQRRADAKHLLHFCAHDQAVTSDVLEQHIPDLRGTIADAKTGAAATYHGYVSGGFLDENVTPERNDFHRFKQEELLFGGSIPWEDMVRAAVTAAGTFLAPYTQHVREAKAERIRRYVETEAYQYRHVVKHRPDLIDRISPEATGNALDLELYRASQIQNQELKQLQQELLERDGAPDADPEDYRAKLAKFLQEWNDVGKDRLAAYVAYRKAILSYLHDQLKRRGDGKYNLEEDIHRIIFPMRATSDDVPADQMNLWMIDERLAFHYYLASDKYLDQLEPLDVEAHRRADIIIFDRAFMFGEDEVDVGAVVIIEFKRPMTDDRDPLRQVYGYVRDVRNGRVTTKAGRPIIVARNTPFYAYILCDLTAKMRGYAEDASLTVTPDEEGYIGFNAAHGVYVEMISYDKVVKDARKRNAIFFEKLGLPATFARAGDDASVNSALRADADGCR